MNKKTITPIYSVVQAFYLVSCCVIFSFAAVYLQDLGYSNIEIGLILVIGNLASTFLGLIPPILIDKSKNFSAANLTPFIFILQAFFFIGLIILPMRCILTSVCFSGLTACCHMISPMLSKLYADFAYNNIKINFGIARGVASFSYALGSVLLGILIKYISVMTLPWLGLIVCVMQIIFHFLLCNRLPKNIKKHETETGTPVFLFIKANPRFCMLLLGIMFIFFGHYSIFSFLINVVKNVGGDEATMGYLNGFMAAIEIPVMLFFNYLRKQKKISVILLFAIFCFALRGIAVAAAISIPALFISFFLQAPSFALYTPAIIDYVNETISYCDSAKAQSLSYSMVTIGAVLSSACAGWLYDNTTVSFTLWVAAIMCIIGVLFAFLALKKNNHA